MKEILCAHLPARLSCADLKHTLAFYRESWGFELLQQVTGVVAVLRRESVTVHLYQRRSDQTHELFACRLLVDSLEAWTGRLLSAPGRPEPTLQERAWGREFALSDCDGNRLLLVPAARRTPVSKASA